MFDRNAPFHDSTSAWFVFAVDGEEIGSFTEVSGLELNVATEDVEEGGVNGYVHKMPGRMSWPNLTLKRGLTKSDNLLAWIESVSGDGLGRERNKISRRTASITLLTDDGRPLRRWDFIGVVPVRWSGPSFAASGPEALVEELEMAHHGFKASNV
ncbi:MAG: phage tail protein [Acidimicrobiales bacterium]|nr:phage tail protein [Acidimicrobiales bacterium]